MSTGEQRTLRRTFWCKTEGCALKLERDATYRSTTLDRTGCPLAVTKVTECVIAKIARKIFVDLKSFETEISLRNWSVWQLEIILLKPQAEEHKKKAHKRVWQRQKNLVDKKYKVNKYNTIKKLLKGDNRTIKRFAKTWRFCKQKF